MKDSVTRYRLEHAAYQLGVEYYERVGKGRGLLRGHGRHMAQELAKAALAIWDRHSGRGGEGKESPWFQFAPESIHEVWMAVMADRERQEGMPWAEWRGVALAWAKEQIKRLGVDARVMRVYRLGCRIHSIQILDAKGEIRTGGKNPQYDTWADLPRAIMDEWDIADVPRGTVAE